MKLLEDFEIEQVAGGFSPAPEGFDPFLYDEFMNYKMGRMSIFGVNPDLQLMDPPPVPG